MATIPLDGKLQTLARLLPTKDVQLDLRRGAVVVSGMNNETVSLGRHYPSASESRMTANMNKPEFKEAMIRLARQKIGEMESLLASGEMPNSKQSQAEALRLLDGIRSGFLPEIGGRVGRFLPCLGNDEGQTAELQKRISDFKTVLDEMSPLPELQEVSPQIPLNEAAKLNTETPKLMTSTKLRVLAFGLLVLCLCVLLPDDGLSLTQLVAASGAWACVVWLWEDRATAFIRAWWKRTILLAFSLFAVAALRHYIIDVLPVEQAASRYGIERAYAEYLVTYWRNGTTRVSDEKILAAMGREKASAYIKAWVHNGGYNRNSMDLPSINPR